METRQVEQLKLNVTNIKSFLVSSNKESQKISAQKSSLIRRQEQSEKRKLKEKNIESVPGSGTAGNIFSKITSPATSFLDKILNFAGSILLGVIVNNLPAIIAKAEEVINVVKPLWDGAVKTIGFIFNTSKTIFEGVVSFFNPKKVESETQEVTAELNSLEKELDFDENILGNLGPLPSEEEFEQDEVEEITEKVPEPVKTIIPVIPFSPPEPQKRNEGGEIIRTTQPNQSPPKSSENIRHPFQRLYNNVHMNRDTLELYRKNIDKYEKINEKLKGISLGGGAPTSEGPPFSPDQTPVPVNVGPIKPGGMLDFIGHGDGATGRLILKDASGKKVGSWEAISGVLRTAGTSQAERTNVSGRLYPLPDGTYPLVAYARHGFVKGVGTWSTFINNASGAIGRRSAVMVHNDIGSNGTAGCIGVELGGTSGTKAEQAFLTLYEAVKPTSVNVSIGKGAKKNQSLKPKPRVTPDNVPVSQAQKNKGKTKTVIIPVEVSKPVPISTSSNNGSTILNTSRSRTSNSLHNIP